MEVVYSDGCSLMAGAEHESWRVNPNTGYEECDTTWSAVLQKRYFPNAKFISRATTATSNFSIARRTLHYVNDLLNDYDPSDILVCIMWTSIYRKEFRTDKGYFSTLPTDNSVSFKQKPTGEIMDYNLRKNILKEYNLYNLADSYYKALNQPINFTLDSMAQIEYVNLFLQKHRIRSIQCHGLGEHFYHLQNDYDEYLQSMTDRIKNLNIYYINKRPPQGFYEWANGSHKLGPGLHPLEGAHEMWANLLAKKYLTSTL
jgi:hypothetical protein